jgi:hypothetical protein
MVKEECQIHFRVADEIDFEENGFPGVDSIEVARNKNQWRLSWMR